MFSIKNLLQGRVYLNILLKQFFIINQIVSFKDNALKEIAAKAINKEAYEHSEFPTIIDGARGMNFIESVVESHEKGNVWITIDNK